MKRIMIELSVISSILLLFILYGAVSFRDAQTHSEDTIAVLSDTNISESYPSEPAQPTETEDTLIQSDQDPGLLQKTGETLADKISRFFLWGIGLIASLIDSLIHTFM